LVQAADKIGEIVVGSLLELHLPHLPRATRASAFGHAKDVQYTVQHGDALVGGKTHLLEWKC
jgi:hypothetical protein